MQKWQAREKKVLMWETQDPSTTPFRIQIQFWKERNLLKKNNESHRDPLGCIGRIVDFWRLQEDKHWCTEWRSARLLVFLQAVLSDLSLLHQALVNARQTHAAPAFAWWFEELSVFRLVDPVRVRFSPQRDGERKPWRFSLSGSLPSLQKPWALFTYAASWAPQTVKPSQ